MAITYTLIKKQDEHILTVQQTTSYVLRFVSDGSNEQISTGSLTTGQSVTLTTAKDGQYQVTLSATGETDVAESFYVIRFLQNSIIADTLTLLCDCSNTFVNESCKTKSEQEAIAVRGLFAKVFAFQFNYVIRYGAEFPNIFTTFLNKGAELVTCNTQTVLNSLLLEECVTGCISNTSRITRLYMAMYWAGMYFTERTVVDTTVSADVEALKTKFNYDKIVACICDLCFTIQELEALFSTNPTTDQIYSFQFPDITKGIGDIAEVTSAFLATNGQLQSETDLIAGKTINFTNIGRIGFVVNTTDQTPFDIFDSLGNNVTTTAFNKVYDTATQRVFFVSINVVAPNSIFFKIVKT